MLSWETRCCGLGAGVKKEGRKPVFFFLHAQIIHGAQTGWALPPATQDTEQELQGGDPITHRQCEQHPDFGLLAPLLAPCFSSCPSVDSS